MSRMIKNSDEEEEDEKDALVYLPVSLEIDEPETAMDIPLMNQAPSDPSTPTKPGKKIKAIDIHMDGVREGMLNACCLQSPETTPITTSLTLDAFVTCSQCFLPLLLLFSRPESTISVSGKGRNGLGKPGRPSGKRGAPSLPTSEVSSSKRAKKRPTYSYDEF